MDKKSNTNKNKNLFTIGEIAKLIGITRKIILNYEAKGLIKPDVKDGQAGNRYYTIDTFTQIRTIRVFQTLGLSLDEIRDYFNDTADLQTLIKRLEIMRDELNLNIERLYERAKKTSNNITEISVDAQTVFCRTYHSLTVSEKSTVLRETALEAMQLYGTDTTKRMYFTEYMLENPEEVTYGIAVPPESEGAHIVHIPGFRAVAVFYHGAYTELPTVREDLIAYAKEKGMEISGKCRHVYVEGPPQHKDVKKFITQVLLPIEEMKK